MTLAEIIHSILDFYFYSGVLISKDWQAWAVRMQNTAFWRFRSLEAAELAGFEVLCFGVLSGVWKITLCFLSHL